MSWTFLIENFVIWYVPELPEIGWSHVACSELTVCDATSDVGLFADRGEGDGRECSAVGIILAG